MINFFRKIRQRLLIQNRFSRYLIYAIGEIFLVVIGILLALRINNWNQERQALKEEVAITKNIHSEFLENNKASSLALKESKKSAAVCKEIMSLMGKDRDELRTYNIDSLIFYALEPGDFRPSDNTISDLVQSGRLKLLTNDSLKGLLYQWQRDFTSLKTSYSRIELKLDNELIPYLSKNYSLKDIDKYGQLEWKQPTNLEIDKYRLFKDIEFENIIDDYLYRVITTQNSQSRIQELINAILNQTAYE